MNLLDIVSKILTLRNPLWDVQIPAFNSETEMPEASMLKTILN